MCLRYDPRASLQGPEGLKTLGVLGSIVGHSCGPRSCQDDSQWMVQWRAAGNPVSSLRGGTLWQWPERHPSSILYYRRTAPHPRALEVKVILRN